MRIIIKVVLDDQKPQPEVKGLQIFRPTPIPKRPLIDIIAASYPGWNR